MLLLLKLGIKLFLIGVGGILLNNQIMMLVRLKLIGQIPGIDEVRLAGESLQKLNLTVLVIFPWNFGNIFMIFMVVPILGYIRPLFLLITRPYRRMTRLNL